MTSPRGNFGSVRRIIGMAALALWPLVGEAPAQTTGQGTRSGGPLPTRETPSISGGQTRDEMLRRFDLDADGRIDEAEAEAARARMRRERIETMQGSGLDPLTGRPRGTAPSGQARDAVPPNRDDLILPGAADDQAPPTKASGDAGKNPPARPAPAVPPGRAPPLTGGIRAGAPAVRPGYGTIAPKSDLNAGRPRDPQPLPNGAAVPRGATPGARMQQQPAGPRAAAPRPSLFPQGSSRPTAEDIGR